VVATTQIGGFIWIIMENMVRSKDGSYRLLRLMRALAFFSAGTITFASRYSISSAEFLYRYTARTQWYFCLKSLNIAYSPVEPFNSNGLTGKVRASEVRFDDLRSGEVCAGEIRFGEVCLV